MKLGSDVFGEMIKRFSRPKLSCPRRLQLSECRLFGGARPEAVWRQPAQNRPLVPAFGSRFQEIAETWVRYGYRRIHVPLRRAGWELNGKRGYRLYREMGLQLRKKSSKRTVKAKLREGRCTASRVNDVWAMDFSWQPDRSRAF